MMQIQTTLVPGAPWPELPKYKHDRDYLEFMANQTKLHGEFIAYLKTKTENVMVSQVAEDMLTTVGKAQYHLDKLRDAGMIFCIIRRVTLTNNRRSRVCFYGVHQPGITDELFEQTKKYAKNNDVLEYLKTQDAPVTVAHIAKDLCLPYTKAQDGISRLRKRGLIVCDKMTAVTRCGKSGIVGIYRAAKQEVTND